MKTRGKADGGPGVPRAVPRSAGASRSGDDAARRAARDAARAGLVPVPPDADAQLLGRYSDARAPWETRTAFKRRWRASRGVGAQVVEAAVSPPVRERDGRGGRRRGPELPRALLTWRERGQASEAMVRAAERFVGDYGAGYLAGTRSVTYRERVDGGGVAGDGGCARGLDARERVRGALAAMGPAAGPAVKAWLIDGVRPVAAVAEAGGWKRAEQQRAAAGGVLLVALHALSLHYGTAESG